uniref:Uncharacterized protein n=1 Tax=Arundo donax TaxID=35708 RepID=A0A0A8ZC52_ARUDO
MCFYFIQVLIKNVFIDQLRKKERYETLVFFYLQL